MDKKDKKVIGIKGQQFLLSILKTGGEKMYRKMLSVMVSLVLFLGVQPLANAGRMSSGGHPLFIGGGRPIVIPPQGGDNQYRLTGDNGHRGTTVTDDPEEIKKLKEEQDTNGKAHLQPPTPAQRDSLIATLLGQIKDAVETKGQNLPQRLRKALEVLFAALSRYIHRS